MCLHLTSPFIKQVNGRFNRLLFRCPVSRSSWRMPGGCGGGGIGNEIVGAQDFSPFHRVPISAQLPVQFLAKSDISCSR